MLVAFEMCCFFFFSSAWGRVFSTHQKKWHISPPTRTHTHAHFSLYNNNTQSNTRTKSNPFFFYFIYLFICNISILKNQTPNQRTGEKKNEKWKNYNTTTNLCFGCAFFDTLLLLLHRAGCSNDFSLRQSRWGFRRLPTLPLLFSWRFHHHFFLLFKVRLFQWQKKKKEYTKKNLICQKSQNRVLVKRRDQN